MSAVARVNLSAFEQNVSSVVSRVAPAHVWVAIKSNAYGHGMLELADNALRAGAAGLAVLDVPAALRLRSHGITAPLFAWLHGAKTDFVAAVTADIDLGVSSLSHLESIALAGKNARVHLKVDTGLHRNGFPINQWDAVCTRAADLEKSGAIRVVGIWTHLADANTAADNAALDIFDDAITRARSAGLHPELLHAAASPTALRNQRARYSLVRVGIAAYGISPFDDVDGAGLELRPVMTVHGTIESTGTETSIIGAGWFDGVPQVRDGAAWVGASDQQYSVLTVGPQHTVIDGVLPVGTVVDIIGGDGPSAELWAEWRGTIGDEIVTGIPTHVRRIYDR